MTRTIFALLPASPVATRPCASAWQEYVRAGMSVGPKPHTANLVEDIPTTDTSRRMWSPPT